MGSLRLQLIIRKCVCVAWDLTSVYWELESDSKTSSTMRSERKDAILSFTSLCVENEENEKERTGGERNRDRREKFNLQPR